MVKYWQFALIGSILGVTIVYFILPFIDNISQAFVKRIIINVKPIRDQFFKNLRERRFFKPNVFIIQLWVFICIFIAIFSYMNLRELKIQTQLAQKKHNSSDSIGVFLNKSLPKMMESLYGTATRFLVINIFLLLLFIYQRAVALLLVSMINNFKNKKIALLKTSISEKDFIMFDFKWGAINSFEEYNNFCNELDVCINKFPSKNDETLTKGTEDET